MTARKHPIFPDQIYHLFNRSVAKLPIFFDTRDYQRFCQVVDFCRYRSQGLRFSHFNRLSIVEKDLFLENLKKNGEKQVAIYAFCLIQNHFHFLLKELKENGIQKFVSNLQNSYAKYFNTKRKRTGALFQEQFKAVRIDSDELFLHVARYIHLNPYLSFTVRNIDELKLYPWSSLNNYMGESNFNFLETDYLNSFFSSKEEFNKFTFDQADFKRRLKEAEHALLDM